MDSYLLALTPPQDISKKVDEYRHKYKKHSYFINPHITIYPPFCLSSISKTDLYDQLSEKLKTFSNVEVNIRSTGFFENGSDRNVAYFKPDHQSTELLRKLFTLCAEYLKNVVSNKYDHYDLTQINYNPHMTISSNIPDNIFHQVKADLENLKENFNFKVRTLDVYEQKADFGIWNKIQEINLNQ